MSIPIRAAAIGLFLAAVSAGPAAAQPVSPEPTDPVAAPNEPTPPITITGSASIASDYRFRGISLTDENPAIQGTINLNHESGLYAGVWASNLDGFGAVGGAGAEFDLYAGIRREVASGVTIDAGLLYYVYPGAEGGEFDYFEPFANVSAVVGPITSKVGFAYAPDQDALGGNDNIYLFNDNSLAIRGTPITLTSHVGYNSGDSGLAFGSNYLDWSLGATATWRNLTIGLSYVDADIAGVQALGAGAARDIVGSTIVATLSASF